MNPPSLAICETRQAMQHVQEGEVICHEGQAAVTRVLLVKSGDDEIEIR